MNGRDKGMTIRNVKEVVDYEALLRAALESTAVDYQALGSAMEAVSEDSRSILQAVMESFAGRYEDAMRLLESRLGVHEANLRWKKVFGFAFKKDLSKEAWRNAFGEFSQVRGVLKKDYVEFLGQIVAARNLMMEQGAEAVRSLLGGGARPSRRLLPPGPDENDTGKRSGRQC